MDIFAGEIEHELVAAFGARSAGHVEDPVGVSAVEVGVGVDHLGFDPEAEVHVEGVDLVDERLQAVGKFCLVDVPVAETEVVGGALAEPAVVHDEALDTDAGGLFGEGGLARIVDGHLGGFPRVIDDGAELRRGLLREDVGDLEAVEDARGFAHSMAGVAGVEDGC